MPRNLGRLYVLSTSKSLPPLPVRRFKKRSFEATSLMVPVIATRDVSGEREQSEDKRIEDRGKSS